MKRAMNKMQMRAPSPSYNRLCQTYKNDCIDPYKKLANAIICVAIDDYRTALRDRNAELKKELDEFFDSEWGRLLSKGMDIDTILKLITKESSQAAIFV